jgi:hypothetical protein
VATGKCAVRAAAIAAAVAAALIGPAAVWTATPARAAEIAEGADAVVLFGEPFREIHAGTGGRMLVVFLQKSKQLFVIDVTKGEAVKDIPAPSDDIRFACSNDRLLIVSPSQKTMQLWSLKKLEREKIAPLPAGGALADIRMGSASSGPAYLQLGSEAVALDLDTLKPLKATGPVPSPVNARVSADGLCVARHGHEHLVVTRLVGGRAFVETRTPHGSSHAWVWNQPTADGGLILRGGQLFDRQGEPVAGDLPKGSIAVPTADPRFFLAVAGNGSRTTLTVLTAGERRPVAALEGLPSVTGSSEPMKWGAVWDVPGHGEPSVILLPGEKLIAVVSADRLTVRRFDLLKAVAGAGAPTVLSLPPSEVTLGETFAYKIEAVSKAGGLKFKLETAPEGMKVSEAGEITWKVTARPKAAKESVIVSVKDASGAESLHSFEILVRTRLTVSPLTPSNPSTPSTPSNPATPAKPATPSKPPTPTGPAAKADASKTAPAAKPGPAGKAEPPAAAAEPGVVVRVDDRRLELPEKDYRIVPGHKGRLLVLCGDRLSVISPDGSKVERAATLPKRYVDIGERADHFVAIGNEPSCVDVLDKKTLQPVRGRKLGYPGVTELALHPTLPISYIGIRKAGRGRFENRFLVYEEKTGEGREGDDWIATWMRVDPAGRFLITGHKDWIAGGLLQPDDLRRYELNADGVPGAFPAQFKEKAGGNGSGIRLSHDGKRVTYLSHVGYPEFSQNLAGFNTADFDRLPVAYETKGRGTTHDLTFHPYLPMAASAGSGSAVFFHQETGDPQPDRLDLPADALGGVKPERTHFSGDGLHLLIEFSSQGVRYLYRVPLKLTPAERKTCESALR